VNCAGGSLGMAWSLPLDHYMWCRSQVSSVAITPKTLLRNQFAHSAVSLLCSSEIAISLSISILVVFDAGRFAIKIYLLPVSIKGIRNCPASGTKALSWPLFSMCPAHCTSVFCDRQTSRQRGFRPSVLLRGSLAGCPYETDTVTNETHREWNFPRASTTLSIKDRRTT
jgi:hypothetical protein